MASFVQRGKRRLVAEAWIIDAAKRHRTSRELRGWIEKQRGKRIVASEGSADAALSAIVDRAISRASLDEHRTDPAPVAGVERSASPPVTRNRPLRVGVLGPLPVSGVEGGNERQWRSLTTSLNAHGHDAEFVGIVSPEGNLEEVLDSYAMWHGLDLSRFDVVISGKYPAFVVRHPRHIRHLSHPLRGLYEHYPTGLPTSISDDLAAQLNACGTSIPAVLEWARKAAAERRGDPVMAFPGPFARAVVQRLDTLGRNEMAAEATMSETVADRPGYTDPNRPISVFAPLTDLEVDLDVEPVLDTGAGQFPKPFIFTFGRLDGAKRFELIIEAFAVARRLPGMADVELVIAGTGPLGNALAELAGERVRLVGRLSDDELQNHLCHALAVALAPVNEDYGLVAAEAMAAATPVITTSDSGGVAEQLEHGRTGLIVHPKPTLIAAAMRSLAVDPDRAKRMGRSARDDVRGTSWQPMFDLIDDVVAAGNRPRIVMVSTFPADPVASGGQRRLRGVATGLHSLGWQPVILSLTNRVGPDAIRRRRTNDGVEHVSVGRSRAHLAADFSMASIVGSPIDDVAAAELWPCSNAFSAEIAAQVEQADVVMLSHPFLVDAVPATAAPVVYDAHNVETDLKAALFAEAPGGIWIADLAATTEAEAIDRADLVCATSAEDLARFEALGVITDHKTTVIAPNPLANDLIDARTEEERRSSRERFFLDLGEPDRGRPIALFLGSDHPPNRAAAARCHDLAAARPDLHVVIGGTVKADGGPATLVGPFAPTDLRRIQTMADVVLNPIETGSGTSLKLIDPLSLGIPIVATPQGARGLPNTSSMVWLAEPTAQAMGNAIDTLGRSHDERVAKVAAGRLVADRARPEQAVRHLSEHLRTLLADRANS